MEIAHDTQGPSWTLNIAPTDKNVPSAIACMARGLRLELLPASNISRNEPNPLNFPQNPSPL
ncbi:hypothetical protein [Teredinibacter purpureus]|uniref:hypothetical protein n=1 Tax=Teredinibacter purpureus TaxID=2731756 RepID=UPI0005F7DE44|nr:hypothetical protein [Teredinibacter purpureus]